MSELISLMKSLSGMDEIELRSLNVAVVEEIRHRQNIKIGQVRATFRVGDKVQFTSKHGGIKVGNVAGIGPKNIKVQIGPYETWTVTPTLLTKIGA